MRFKVSIEGQTFEVEVEDTTARPVIAVVDGERFEVWPEDERAAMPAQVFAAPQTTLSAARPVSAPSAPRATATASRPVAPSATGSTGAAVRAPIPGVIVGVSVEPGKTVERGQELMVLEAMKMKNAVRATRPGTVKAVHVSVGQQVKQRDLLLEFED